MRMRHPSMSVFSGASSMPSWCVLSRGFAPSSSSSSSLRSSRRWVIPSKSFCSSSRGLLVPAINSSTLVSHRLCPSRSSAASTLIQMSRPLHLLSNSSLSGGHQAPHYALATSTTHHQTISRRHKSRTSLQRRPHDNHFKPLPIVPYGVRMSKAYSQSKRSMRRAAVHGRKMEERTGILLDTKKCLRMEAKRNSGIGWTKSLKLLKHLEVHVRTKGPPCNQEFRDKVTQIAWRLKQQRP
ncbi:unnamed protein product [Amoebophrya sp. A25]|nr:unnamed protein product [Amoebophrya sp. A25]|eukprot:GSA25T00017096001.1